MKVPYIENDYGKIKTNEIKLNKIAEQYSIREAHIGFILNIMVIGRRNLGSSTLVNSLFAAPLILKERNNKFTTTINELIEDEVKLRIITTTYHEIDFNAVLKFLNSQNEEYFSQENGSFTDIDDRRVHVCLYIFPSDFIEPDELNGIKLISKHCNFIPIISKADMYTTEELNKRRAELLNICHTNEINIYNFNKPNYIFESNKFENNIKWNETLCKISGNDFDDENENEIYRNKDDEYILATITSEKVYEIQGNIVRGRRYPWGFIDINNEKYSDFKKLQRILLQDNYEDLLYRTDVFFYNNYRNNRTKENDEDYQQLMKRRLTTLQTQLEKMLIKKHEIIMGRLRNEEKEIENELENKNKNKNSVINSIDEIKIVESNEDLNILKESNQTGDKVLTVLKN